jgi:MFS family permease
MSSHSAPLPRVGRLFGLRNVSGFLTSHRPVSMRPGSQLGVSTPAVSRPAVSRLGTGSGFWAVGFGFATAMAFSTLPTPLYPIYQHRIGFGQFMITVVFAAYAVGVVLSLYLAGHLSDQLGRRRVLVSGLLTEAGAAAMFLEWPTLPGLIAARFLSGLGIGVIVATATAYLAELYLASHRKHQPSTHHRPTRAKADLLTTATNMGGVGAGPLIAGLLAQFTHRPLHTPYQLFLVLLLLSAAATALAPETVTPQSERHPWRPQRISIPESTRKRYLAAAAAAFTSFAVMGLFTSLAPSVVSGMFAQPSRALAGAVTFLVFAAAAVAQIGLSRTAARKQISWGMVLIGLGLLSVSAAIWLPSLPLFLVGGGISGAGAGVLFKGSVVTVSGITPAASRGEALAGLFLAAYAGLTVPVLCLGAAVQLVPLRYALLGFVLMVLTAVGAVGRQLLGPSVHHELEYPSTSIDFITLVPIR